MKLETVNKSLCFGSQEAFESEREGELRKALSLLRIHLQETRISPQVSRVLTCHAPLHVWINFQHFTLYFPCCEMAPRISVR